MEKRKNIFLLIVVILIFACTNSNNKVYALEGEAEILRFHNDNSATISLSNQEKSLYIESVIKANNPRLYINGTAYLERYTYGGWVSIKSWSFSGNGTVLLSEMYSSVSGGLYRARLSATVNGERISAVSDSVRL